MLRISEILAFLDEQGIQYTFRGDNNTSIDRFSSLAHYKGGSFTWIKKQDSIPVDFDLSQIALAIVTTGIKADLKNVIETDESKRAFFSTIEHFYAEEEDRPAIGQFTYISPKVRLGKNVRIGHNCTLDGDITIGDNTVIWNGVTIVNRVVIGNDCEIQSGTIIGHDGFGYTENENHKKTMVKHYGGVFIGNNVFIADNVTVSRGTIDDTTIEDGVKIDALTRVGHNSYFEEDAALALPCGISGSVHLGKNAYVGGATIRNQCVIGENAFVGMGAIVVKDVEPNQIVVGNPARPFAKSK